MLRTFERKTCWWVMAPWRSGGQSGSVCMHYALSVAPSRPQLMPAHTSMSTLHCIQRRTRWWRQTAGLDHWLHLVICASPLHLITSTLHHTSSTMISTRHALPMQPKQHRVSPRMHIVCTAQKPSTPQHDQGNTRRYEDTSACVQSRL